MSLPHHSVILVDEKDQPVGTMEKMEAHEKGLLHRAFSVFLFDHQGRMLLQQRAGGKYHGAHLWTNACCSHPAPGEDVHSAALRRMQEELGMQTAIKEVFSFIYRADVENGLVEHEFDHVFAGQFEGEMQLNAEEVEAVRYVALDDLKSEMAECPDRFTIWFRIAFPRVEAWWKAQYPSYI